MHSFSENSIKIIMCHTILLLQWDQFAESRIFMQFETPVDCINSICRIYEESMQLRNADEEIVQIDMLEMYNFLDGLNDIVCLVHSKESNTYEPHTKNWIKEQLYKQLV